MRLTQLKLLIFAQPLFFFMYHNDHQKQGLTLSAFSHNEWNCFNYNYKTTLT